MIGVYKNREALGLKHKIKYHTIPKHTARISN